MQDNDNEMETYDLWCKTLSALSRAVAFISKSSAIPSLSSRLKKYSSGWTTGDKAINEAESSSIKAESTSSAGVGLEVMELFAGDKFWSSGSVVEYWASADGDWERRSEKSRTKLEVYIILVRNNLVYSCTKFSCYKSFGLSLNQCFLTKFPKEKHFTWRSTKHFGTSKN